MRMKRNFIMTLIALIAIAIPAMAFAQVSVLKVKPIVTKLQYKSPSDTDKVVKGFLVVDYDVNPWVPSGTTEVELNGPPTQMQKYLLNSISYVECSKDDVGVYKYFEKKEFDTRSSFMVKSNNPYKIAMKIRGHHEFNDEICRSLILLKGKMNPNGYIKKLHGFSNEYCVYCDNYHFSRPQNRELEDFSVEKWTAERTKRFDDTSIENGDDMVHVIMDALEANGWIEIED